MTKTIDQFWRETGYQMSPVMKAYIRQVQDAPMVADPFTGKDPTQIINTANRVASIRPQIREEEFRNLTGIGYDALNQYQQNLDMASRIYLETQDPRAGALLESAVKSLEPLYTKLASIPEDRRQGVGITNEQIQFATSLMPTLRSSVPLVAPQTSRIEPTAPVSMAAEGSTAPSTLSDAQYNQLRTQYPGLGADKASYENAIKSGAISAPTGVAPTTTQTLAGGANGATNQGATGQKFNVVASNGQIAGTFNTQQEAQNYASMIGGGATVQQGTGGIQPATPASTTTATPASNTLADDNTKLALQKIDQTNLPEDIKFLWKEMVSIFKGTTIDIEEILNTFNKIKSETIDPYYRQIINLATDDFKRNLSQLQQARDIETEQERMAKEEAIKSTQAGLERRGMTFTGEALGTLGTASAYGTTMPEGSLEKKAKLFSKASSDTYLKNIRNVGAQAEAKLGTAKTAELPLSGYTPTSGITGEAETTKQKDYGQTLRQLIDNYYKKFEIKAS